MSQKHPTSTRKAYAASSPARKLWAVGCVVGFGAFLIFGYIALTGAVAARPTPVISYVLCLAGLGLGVVSWFKVMSVTPPMTGRRAAARARLEEEYRQTDN
jgi:hypothetical protein